MDVIIDLVLEGTDLCYKEDDWINRTPKVDIFLVGEVDLNILMNVPDFQKVTVRVNSENLIAG